ncbi:iron-siderophore ABC transporter substrate-binding protein [Arthrobacter sp. I2-34]|uniref:Iron-siderophore ABC transporter substrate-binding protein n=1 Tax=Arthrobacter hankyongi TaxID=2904801 RepID=A0ABS9L9V5_9MICC|nr:iron-siderophore ABC transporter substrate-binding protein [Arthrobacter hankyongi]MCG2623257.1 iron-siderophore ABC transporter substrate-binding protein [Arthrobacter hankyongi]
MDLSLARRLAAAAAVVLLSLTACATGPAGGTGAAADPADGTDFPVTIEHAFGETVIDKQPARVATVSWVNADVALAFGVVPVGMAADEWGGNQNASTPWKDARLQELDAAIGTGKAPKQYSEADGIAFDEIAALTPDVILAAYSGLTEEDYKTLSKIAPVVAYPDVAWGTPWQDSTRMIGQALGKNAEAEALVAATEQTVADKAADYPQLKGKSFIYGNLEPDRGDGINIYLEQDNRPRFLSSIGMTMSPFVAEAGKDSPEFFLPWSSERANELESDVFVTWVPDAKTKEAIKQDPLLGQIPAVKSGALVADSDNTLTLAISAASPLSLPWALDKFLPLLGEAADAADAAK